jgi:hypothetical protein
VIGPKVARNTVKVGSLPGLNDDFIPYDLQNMTDSSSSEDENGENKERNSNDPE